MAVSKQLFKDISRGITRMKGVVNGIIRALTEQLCVV